MAKIIVFSKTGPKILSNIPSSLTYPIWTYMYKDNDQWYWISARERQWVHIATHFVPKEYQMQALVLS